MSVDLGSWASVFQVLYSVVAKEGCLVGVFSQMERVRGRPKAVMGLHSGPGS